MKEKIVNSLIIIIGNILLAISTSFFVLPFNLDIGGLAGISVILGKWFYPSVVIFILNWLLFFIGWIFLKKDFALKTLLSTIIYPLAVVVLNQTKVVNIITSEVTDPLLAAIMAGVFVGIGLGLVFKVGGSTGGLDVVSVMLNKYLGIKISHATFAIDSVIVILGAFLVNINSSLYGIIAAVVGAYLIEIIIMRGNSSYMMHIVSNHIDEINNYIILELERGSTFISVRGGISKEEKEMIEVIFNEKEYYKIKKEIQKIDKDAFISVYKAVNVYGNGFEKMNRK